MWCFTIEFKFGLNERNNRLIYIAVAVIALIVGISVGVYTHAHSKSSSSATTSTTTIPLLSYTSSIPNYNTTTAGQSTTISPNIVTNSTKERVMANFITWTNQNGYSSIQWNELTELDVFNMWILPNGTLIYDGFAQSPAIPTVISTAYDNNVSIVLAIGGSGESNQTLDELLSNSTFRTIVINNIVNQVNAQDYGGVQIDFEGYFNQQQFTVFMQQLSAALWAKNPNYIINLEVAGWDRHSFNVEQLSPYVTNFDIQFNPPQSELQMLASQAGNSSKISAGYDLTNLDNFTNLGANLAMDKANGYGVYFYSTAQMNSTVWTALSNLSTQT